jgi:hypothetical protein
MFIKPNSLNKTADGTPVQVFDPIHKDFIPADGRAVPDNEYWFRRLRAGEVIKIDKLPTKKGKTKEKAPSPDVTKDPSETKDPALDATKDL